MTPHGTGSPHGTYRREILVITAVIVAVSFIGFFMGTDPVNVTEPHRPATASSEGVETARSYGDLRERPLWERQNRPAQLAALAPAVPTPDAQLTKHPERTERDVARRAERRAFDGAPPVVPHPVPQRGALPCLACHEKGAVMGEVRAPAISHEHYASCTQCHVPSGRAFAEAEELPFLMAESAFVGLSSPRSGARAWAGAPPLIPHSTHMRTACASCHGPAGLPGLQSTHPWRQNCAQCHGSSADMDQRPLLSGELPPPWAMAEPGGLHAE